MKKKTLLISIFLVLCLLSVLLGCDKEETIDCNGNTAGTKEEVEENDSQQEETKTRFGFIGDLHYLSESEIESDTCESFLSYRYTGERMLSLSSAILKSAVDRYIEEKVEAVFICGDLTEMGSKVGLEEIAAQCEKLKKSGIKVYVAAGSNDIRKGLDFQNLADNTRGTILDHLSLSYLYTPVKFTSEGRVEEEGISEEEFKELFSSYGYDNAVSVDENSLSYATDINDEIRLINYSIPYYQTRVAGYPHFSSTVNNLEKPKVTLESLNWLESALQQAQEDKKEVLLMSFLPLFDNIYQNVGTITNYLSLPLQDCELVQELCTTYGVKYVISGNTHINAERTFSDGENTCTNITCPSLSNYPLDLLFIEYKGGNWSKTSKKLSALKEEYLPSYISDEVKAKVTTDLVSYSKEFLETEIGRKIEIYFNEERFYKRDDAYFLKILMVLGLKPYDKQNQKVDEVWALADEMHEKANEILYMPFYGENSMESHAAKYDYVMPASKYTNLVNMMASLFCDIYDGIYENKEGSDLRKIYTAVGITIMDEAADFGIFTRFHEFNSSCSEYDTHTITEEVITTGTFSLKKDDMVGKFLSMFTIYINEHAPEITKYINENNASSLLSITKVIIPIAFSIAYPWAYENDSSTTMGTIFGVDLTKYVDFNKHTINVQKMNEDLLFDIFIKDLLY